MAQAGSLASAIKGSKPGPSARRIETPYAILGATPLEYMLEARPIRSAD